MPIVKKISLYLLLLVLTTGIFAGPVEFKDALEKNLITAELDGISENPHFLNPLHARIKNVTSAQLQLHIPAGYIFGCQDTSFQDLIITEDVMITLNSGQSVEKALNSMCIEKNNSAPTEGIGYKFTKLADESLLKLAEYINEKKYFNSMAQQALWCITDGNSIENIDGEKEIAQDLREFTCGLLGIPVPEWSDDDYMNDGEYEASGFFIEIKGTMTFHLGEPTHIIIGLFNENGIIEQELYNINKLDRGSYRKTYSFDATVYTDAIYYIQLVEDGKITLKSKVDLTHMRDGIPR